MNRINEEMKKEMSNILREIKDPRVTAMVSVTEAEVTNDLKYAKIYLSIFGKDKEEEKETLAALNKARGYIRHQLSMRLNLRNTPELRLIEDTTIDYGMHIDSLLRDVIPAKAGEVSETPEADEETRASADTKTNNKQLEVEGDSPADDDTTGEMEEDEKA